MLSDPTSPSGVKVSTVLAPSVAWKDRADPSSSNTTVPVPPEFGIWLSTSTFHVHLFETGVSVSVRFIVWLRPCESKTFVLILWLLSPDAPIRPLPVPWSSRVTLVVKPVTAAPPLSVNWSLPVTESIDPVTASPKAVATVSTKLPSVDVAVTVYVPLYVVPSARVPLKRITSPTSVGVPTWASEFSVVAAVATALVPPAAPRPSVARAVPVPTSASAICTPDPGYVVRN